MIIAQSSEAHMASKLIQSHTEFTRNLIKEKFIELYEKKGLEKITVSEICEACSISRSAFYQHFDDKYSVLETIENELFEHFCEINEDMHTIKIQDTDFSIPHWVETLKYIKEKEKFIKPLICYPGDPSFVHKWNNLIQGTIRKRLLADNYHNARNIDLMIYSMASAMIGMYEYWFQHEPDLSPETIAETGTRLLWSSFYNFPK